MANENENLEENVTPIFCDEEEDDGLTAYERMDEELNGIYRIMKCLREKGLATSRDYMVLSQRATELANQKANLDESERNQAQAREMKGQRWNPLIQAVTNIAGAAVGSAVGQMLNRKTVNDVLNCERDGYIPNSRAVSFLQKPRN